MEIDKARLKPNTDEVVSKVIDGEAVIINLSNGVYYSTDKLGAEIWGLVSEVASANEIVEAIASQYDVDRAKVEEDVAQMLNRLVEEDLVLEASVDEGSARSAAPTRTEKGVYESPTLQVYRDMGDLLALDPPQPGLENTPWKGDGDGQSSEKTA